MSGNFTIQFKVPGVVDYSLLAEANKNEEDDRELAQIAQMANQMRSLSVDPIKARRMMIEEAARDKSRASGASLPPDKQALKERNHTIIAALRTRPTPDTRSPTLSGSPSKFSEAIEGIRMFSLSGHSSRERSLAPSQESEVDDYEGKEKKQDRQKREPPPVPYQKFRKMVRAESPRGIRRSAPSPELEMEPDEGSHHRKMRRRSPTPRPEWDQLPIDHGKHRKHDPNRMTLHKKLLVRADHLRAMQPTLKDGVSFFLMKPPKLRLPPPAARIEPQGDGERRKMRRKESPSAKDVNTPMMVRVKPGREAERNLKMRKWKLQHRQREVAPSRVENVTPSPNPLPPPFLSFTFPDKTRFRQPLAFGFKEGV